MIHSSERLSIRRVAWLFDSPSGFDPSYLIHVLEPLNDALDSGRFEIQPIHIAPGVRGSQNSQPENQSMPSSSTGSTPLLATSWLRLQILPVQSFHWENVSDAVLSYYLSCYAQLTHTDLMIAQTDLRKKAFQGLRSSFLSTLSQETKVPLLIVDPSPRTHAIPRLTRLTQLTRRIRNILFPTVNPNENTESFRHLIQFSQLADAKITVLYRFTNEFKKGLWNPLSLLYFGAIPFYEPIFMLEEGTRRKTLASWIELGRKEGVTVEIQPNRSHPSFFSGMLHYLKEAQQDLIAIDPISLHAPLFSQAMSEAALKTGCPIWIARPLGQSAYAGILRRLQTQRPQEQRRH